EAPPQDPPVLASNVIVAPATAGPIVAAVPSETPEGPHTAEASGPGIEGEQTVWEGHYSFKNFLGRLIFGVLFALVWLGLAVTTWGLGRGLGELGTGLLGLAVVAYWVYNAFKYLRAYRGHHYRLTTRRLFITTGFFRRRVDQVELIRV